MVRLSIETEHNRVSWFYILLDTATLNNIKLLYPDHISKYTRDTSEQARYQINGV